MVMNANCLGLDDASSRYCLILLYVRVFVMRPMLNDHRSVFRCQLDFILESPIGFSAPSRLSQHIPYPGGLGSRIPCHILSP